MRQTGFCKIDLMENRVNERPVFVIRTGVRIKRHQYDAYRKVRNEMQQLMKAQKNMELFFAEDKSNLRQQHTR